MFATLLVLLFATLGPNFDGLKVLISETDDLSYERGHKPIVEPNKVPTTVCALACASGAVNDHTYSWRFRHSPNITPNAFTVFRASRKLAPQYIRGTLQVSSDCIGYRVVWRLYSNDSLIAEGVIDRESPKNHLDQAVQREAKISFYAFYRRRVVDPQCTTELRWRDPKLVQPGLLGRSI